MLDREYIEKRLETVTELLNDQEPKFRRGEPNDYESLHDTYWKLRDCLREVENEVGDYY